MSARFYINWPLTPGPVEMSGPEARHLATVCRFRAGDQLCLFNGDGHEYPAHVVAVSKKSVCLDIERRETPNRELGFSLTIAAPIPKGDRAQFLVEKLTELGVTTYIPLLCERAVIEPRQEKIDKLQRYVVEASKQCGRNVLMGIGPPMDWATFRDQGEPDSLRILAHPTTCENHRASDNAPPAKYIGAVGPEGGFTENEIAGANGWQTVNLGPRILRIETAALVLATTVFMHRAATVAT